MNEGRVMLSIMRMRKLRFRSVYDCPRPPSKWGTVRI